MLEARGSQLHASCLVHRLYLIRGACRCPLHVMGAWRRIDGDREHAMFDRAVSWRRGSCQRDEMNEALNRRVWLQPAELEHLSEGQVQSRPVSSACFLASGAG